MLQCLCTLSSSVFFLSASVHPHSVPLCSPTPLHAVCCLTVSAVCLVKATPFLLSVSGLAVLACSLPVFSFFSPLSLSGCMLGSKKRNSLLLSVQRGHIQFLFMKKKLKMSDFSVFFTSHYFQLPMLPAVGQMNNINYQGDIHERIK